MLSPVDPESSWSAQWLVKLNARGLKSNVGIRGVLILQIRLLVLSACLTVAFARPEELQGAQEDMREPRIFFGTDVTTTTT